MSASARIHMPPASAITFTLFAWRTSSSIDSTDESRLVLLLSVSVSVTVLIISQLFCITEELTIDFHRSTTAIGSWCFLSGLALHAILVNVLVHLSIERCMIKVDIRHLLR